MIVKRKQNSVLIQTKKTKTLEDFGTNRISKLLAAKHFILHTRAKVYFLFALKMVNAMLNSTMQSVF